MCMQAAAVSIQAAAVHIHAAAVGIQAAAVCVQAAAVCMQAASRQQPLATLRGCRQRLLGLLLERGKAELNKLVPARKSEKRLFVPLPPPRRKHWLTPAQLKRLLMATGREPPLPAALRLRVVACGGDVERVGRLFVRWLENRMCCEAEADGDETEAEGGG